MEELAQISASGLVGKKTMPNYSISIESLSRVNMNDYRG